MSHSPLGSVLNPESFAILSAYAEMHEPDARLGCTALRCVATGGERRGRRGEEEARSHFRMLSDG